MDQNNKILHQRAMQLALRMADLSLAISHLKTCLFIEPTPEEDKLLGEMILQKGLLEIQTGGKHFPVVKVKLSKNLNNYPQKYFEAIAYLLGDRKKDALGTIDEILESNPGNIEALILKAKTLWSLEQEIEGNDFMWRAYLLDPHHQDVNEFVKKVRPEIQIEFEKASELLLRENYEQALVHLKRGLDKNKNDFELNLVKAFILRKQQYFKDTIVHLESMKLYLGTLPRAALSLDEQKERTQKLDLNFGLVYNDMGVYLFQKGEFADARTVFEEAKRFRFNDPGVVSNIGDCHMKMSKPDEAEKWYKKARELAKEQNCQDVQLLKELYARESYLYEHRALNLFNLGKYELSLQEIERALTLHITKEKLHLKASAYLQIKQPEKAIQVYQTILKKDPKDEASLQFMNQFAGRK